MSTKFVTPGGSMAVRPLEEVVSGGSAEDFVADGTIAKIVPESAYGYYPAAMSKNAVSVIMERCELKDGKIVGTGEAVQVSLGMFDRIATPYVKEGDGKVVREPGKDSVRADGTAVVDWKKAENAKKFMTSNVNKCLKFAIKATVKVRAWDRAANAPSATELRDQKVYTIDWAE